MSAESAVRRASRRALLRVYRAGYGGFVRPIVFRSSAQAAHERLLGWLRLMDSPGLHPLLGVAGGIAQAPAPLQVGGAALDAPLILAAGLVKGEGFSSEEAALAAVRRGTNIIPGWRGLPRLAGLVEFGSFTRWPRLGNTGTVVWRDVPTRSTQNRIGLRNPGARAAAAFLSARRDRLPRSFGINIAVSPGVSDPDVQRAELLQALAFFTEAGVFPTWFTLNLSCPNTEDDPRGHQTADEAHLICAAMVEHLRQAATGAAYAVPLWVKLGPNLNDAQYQALMRVFAENGIQAVVATNTFPAPAPDEPGVSAGFGGGRLHARALEVVRLLNEARQTAQVPVDIVGCGGVMDGETYRDFAGSGALAVQYWSALVFDGPMAGALIADEAKL